MEELIYIIIGVIWLAATIYKASQKKKAAHQKPVLYKYCLAYSIYNQCPLTANCRYTRWMLFQ